MAESHAKLTNLRVAPRKVRLVADMIRGKKVADARNILEFTLKRSALPIQKLLNSAVANAENAAAERHERLDTDGMIISRILVNESMTVHRYQSAPRGRANRIRKRGSHIELQISDEVKKG
jgi:large subunit ribosomal protein L22